jgi:triosephosphate isomerase
VSDLASGWDVSPPFFVVNFKAYLYGRNAVRFCSEAEKIGRRHGVGVIVVPQVVDISRIAESTEALVFAPHLDPIAPGRGTGSVLPEAVKEAGAVGAMFNHAERRMTLDEIGLAIKRADEVGLVSMVCADRPEDVPAIAGYNPNIIGTEPPGLIGTAKSVGRMDKDFVRRSAEIVKKINPRIIVGSGAGVVTGADAGEIIRLGAEMTGATSGILTSQDPVKTLDEMVKAVKNAWDERTRRSNK